MVDEELDLLMEGLPAIALEGPKGVGKTSTAERRAVTVYRLDEPARRGIVEADPFRLQYDEPPVLVDEWQRVPATWDAVRRAVDADPAPGRFLLTGSAAPEAPATHSGAGRIVTLRMRPMTLAERGVTVPTVSLQTLLSGAHASVAGSCALRLDDYTEEILASGFPGLRGQSGRMLRLQLDGYLRRIVDRDFAELGQQVRNPAALTRWLTAYGAATATSASYEVIRDAATSGQGDKPARSTTIPYRDALERLWILDPLPAWLPTRNPLSRLVVGPKHHLADPALAARLLGVGIDALLEGSEPGPHIPRDGTLLGHLFESLVTLCVRVAAQACEASVQHLRTGNGRQEIDLIVEADDRRVLAIEVKLGQTVTDHDVRHLHWLATRIGGDLLDAVVVTTGPEAYRRRDGIAVVPAGLLGP